MRKLSARVVAMALFVVLAAGLTAAPVALASEQADGMSVAITGWITDATCGVANANAEGKACTVSCVKNGAKLVLYSDEKLYPLDDQALAMEHVGVEVKVTGVLKDGAIEVKSIEPTKT
jgi:hypothetical protein